MTDPGETHPAASVLLPCRNAATHLPEAIASLEAQTFRGFEVVAVDDGSSDDTRALLEAWAARDARVRVFAQRATGVVAALARAADAANGAVLVRMDADDVAHPDRIRLQLELLHSRSDIGACGTLVRYFPRHLVQGGARRYETWLNALIEPDAIARDVFVECPIAHPTLAIRRDVFERAGGYEDHGWPEDHDLVLRLWRAGVRMAKVPLVLLDWRESGDRASRTDPRYCDDAFRRCKVHHLRASLLYGRDGVVVWGAGSVGKAFARELLRQGETVRAFVDLDPRKIGQTIHGAPVIPPADIGRYRGAFCVAAVGQPLARHEIRAALDAAGWGEGVDYVAVA